MNIRGAHPHLVQGVDFSGLDILIVEDHAPMRRILHAVLEEFGITKVQEATNGRDALEMFETGLRPDVIITDFRMEPVNGVDMTRLIRDGETTLSPFTPIVMVSAYTEMDKIFEARDAGINEFLAKPVSAKLLFSRLRAVVEKPRPFIRTMDFFGPERRRRPVDAFSQERRHSPHPYPGQDGRSHTRS